MVGTVREVSSAPYQLCGPVIDRESYQRANKHGVVGFDQPSLVDDPFDKLSCMIIRGSAGLCDDATRSHRVVQERVHHDY